MYLVSLLQFIWFSLMMIGIIIDHCLRLQVFEVAPSLHMVELRKTGGDTLEFHKACDLWTLILILSFVFDKQEEKPIIIHIRISQFQLIFHFSLFLYISARNNKDIYILRSEFICWLTHHSVLWFICSSTKTFHQVCKM